MLKCHAKVSNDVIILYENKMELNIRISAGMPETRTKWTRASCMDLVSVLCAVSRILVHQMYRPILSFFLVCL